MPASTLGDLVHGPVRPGGKNSPAKVIMKRKNLKPSCYAAQILSPDILLERP